ncbi:hypothetical protein Cabys_1597 [Caldithrix abyssi DSM 13497]|uniref:Uncharacterized protein n=1 Tax=Caldithrix abyssi DSM 13497 TaxID=880073 RepID=A0A1J1C8M1_CALAY|nr:hypothetical protein Cabys_1597 [Caldithrix abyssi DSM 13497]
MDVKRVLFIGNMSHLFKIDFKIFHLILLPDNINNCYILKKNKKKSNNFFDI